MMEHESKVGPTTLDFDDTRWDRMPPMSSTLFSDGSRGPGGLGGGREPPRKASTPELCYLAVLVVGWRHCSSKGIYGGASYVILEIWEFLTCWVESKYVRGGGRLPKKKIIFPRVWPFGGPPGS